MRAAGHDPARAVLLVTGSPPESKSGASSNSATPASAKIRLPATGPLVKAVIARWPVFFCFTLHGRLARVALVFLNINQNGCRRAKARFPFFSDSAIFSFSARRMAIEYAEA